MSTYPLDAGHHVLPISTLDQSVVNTCDSSLSDVTSAADIPSAATTPILTSEVQPSLETSAIARDSALLSFSSTRIAQALLDHNARPVEISVLASIHGMFSLAAGSPSTSSSASRPVSSGGPKLTCYRRNLFQVSGKINVPRSMRYIVTNTGHRVQIMRQEISVSGIEADNGSPIKLISVPGKHMDTSHHGATENKTDVKPPSILVNDGMRYGHDSATAQIPFHWKRLQFRTATANNGRRRELQQTYRLYVSLNGMLADGQMVTLARVQTHGIIVRGRSPRNFSSRKDMPISGSGHHARKQPSVPGQLSKTKRSLSRTGMNRKHSISAVGSVGSDFSEPSLTPGLRVCESLPISGTQSRLSHRSPSAQSLLPNMYGNGLYPHSYTTSTISGNVAISPVHGNTHLLMDASTAYDQSPMFTHVSPMGILPISQNLQRSTTSQSTMHGPFGHMQDSVRRYGLDPVPIASHNGMPLTHVNDSFVAAGSWPPASVLDADHGYFRRAFDR